MHCHLFNRPRAAAFRAMETAALVAAVALVAAGCGGETSPTGGPAAPESATSGSALPERPLVVLLSLDTVRADGLGCYGGDGVATPHLDRLAARSDRYVSCTATSSWTLPSHASMFTGLFPFEHGAHGFHVETFQENAYALSPDHVTLAEGLRRAGYRTSAVVCNTVYLATRYGMDQGFERYDCKRRAASDVADRLLEEVDAHAEAKGNAPLFLFGNFMDAHRPYAAMSWGEMVTLPDDEHPSKLLDALYERVIVEGQEPGALGAKVRGLYDSALTRLDAEVGRFLDGLESRGMLDEALVIVTSDHGEAFGEGGFVEHAKGLIEPLVAVPLIVKRPGQSENRAVRARASLVDVPGIVAMALGGEPRKDLVAAFDRVPGDHPIISELYYARPRDLKLYGDRFQTRLTAVQHGTKTFIFGGPATGEIVIKEWDGGKPTDSRIAAVRIMQELRLMRARGTFSGARRKPGDPNAAEARDIGELGYGSSGAGAAAATDSGAGSDR